MVKFLNLVLSGSVTGAIYSIMASGLVLTYTTSGLFNFAHGAIAFTTAYLYYQLHSGLGVPIVPALLISVFLFAPLLGVALDRLLLRRLAKAPVYARIVGTIGLLVALPNLAKWLVVTIGINVLQLGLLGDAAVDQGARVPGIGPTPADVYHPLHGVALTSDQLAVFVVAALAAFGLWFMLGRTRVGLEMRAVVDSETLAGLRGVNAARTSATAWFLTTILAGLGGVLIAPLFSLNDSVFTLVVLGSLAAVVLGGMRSLPIAFAGGLGVGIVQNLVAGYNELLPDDIANLTGLRSAVPYLLVLVLGLVIGRDRSRQAGSVADDRPPLDHRRGMSALRRRLPWAAATLALVVFSMGWIDVAHLQASSYAQTVIAQSLATGIIFLSFVVVTGIGGMVSLAQASFVTAGGFAAGWALNRDWHLNIPLIASHGHLNFVWAALIATLVAAALGALIALPATRLGAVYLAIWSLAAAFFLSLVPFAWDPIGKGQTGWTIPAPTLDVPGLNWLHHLLTRGGGHFDFSLLPDQILLFLMLFGLVTAMIHALGRSASGRAMLAARSSQVAAQAAGIRTNRVKIMIFALSAGIAGFGGVMLSTFSFAASNSTAPPLIGLFWLALAVMFGIRRPGGALLAGFALAAGTAIFHWLAADILPGGTVNQLVTSAYFVPLLSGLGAIGLAQEPDGILSMAGHQALRRRQARQRRASIAAVESAAHAGVVPDHELIHLDVVEVRQPEPDTALAVTGIVAGYGGVEVLHGVTIDLRPGRVVALLGANGAGKSTLCAVCAGLLAPTAGTVSLGGAGITALPAFQRARSGLLLAPEARGVFPGLTVEENLTILLGPPELRARAYDRFPALARRRRQAAGLLSGGEQQLLSLAPALIDPPAVLIADEPTLGLAPLATEEIMRAILELRDLGAAVLIVEERAENALQVADTLAFMELGTISWSGPRDEVDVEQLTAAYLGGTPSPS
ncbi:ABC transporter permease subunit [Frankia gtarii]|uniref:ABC transporter permease subunit n=1 Tax=Frankia gtarii TaxID=2950102 RepID=UPI0021C22D9D|nr:ATP-binding cassette domain-containing protein [Frankia gtarii]